VVTKVPKCYIRIKKDFRNHTSFKFFLGLDFSLFFGFYFPTQFNNFLGSRNNLREERKQLTNIALWGLGFVLSVRLKRQNAPDAKEIIGLRLKKNNKNQKTPRPILPLAGVKRSGGKPARGYWGLGPPGIGGLDPHISNNYPGT